MKNSVYGLMTMSVR